MAWGDVMSGAASGASIGTGIMPGWGTAIGGLVGGAAGGLLGRSDKETQMQKKQKELVDQMLASLNGQGPYSNLFNVDESTFQKSFVDPMKQKFSSQIAPQIQQSFIANGQQRGTGMQGNLTRAGVDMDQLLNQQYAQMQQQGQSNQMNMMNSILGMAPGAPTTPSAGQSIMQGIGGYLSSDNFGKDIQGIINRKGFEQDPNSLRDSYSTFRGKPQYYDYATGEMK